jgi:FkbM family methyltransferase
VDSEDGLLISSSRPTSPADRQATSFRRHLIRALDRRGGRRLLGKLATWHVRRTKGADVAVFFDGERWVRAAAGGRLSVDGMRFDYHPDTISNFEREYDAWVREAEDYWFYTYRPQPGGVIIDVGAGIGTDTLVFAKAVGNTGRVVAIEAHPETFARLQKNCAAHRFSNVTCVQAAVVDKPGTVHIETGEQHDANSIQLGESAPGTLPVPGVTLDSLCAANELDHIDFIKMNIEGAERLAIHGMRRVAGMARHICIAAHSFRTGRGEGDFFDTRGDVVTFLLDAGFQINTRDDDPRPWARDHIHGVKAA